MKSWKTLRDCRLKGEGVHHAMLGIARLHNSAHCPADAYQVVKASVIGSGLVSFT